MRKIWTFLKWAVALFFASTVLAVIVLRWVPVWVTPLMVIRSISPKAKSQERFEGWQHQWVPLEQMSPWMPKAVVASEDGRFYDHHGFDFVEINNALEERASGKRERGASTITQQTAKNVFLWPGHSWVRKGLEAYFTVLIELLWSKERIMEVYLNSIEMGPGIYGVEAAAEHYFGCEASRLSRRQCALIAVSLPNPIKRNPARPSGYMSRRAATIQRWM
ncbi:MAG: monofunctional biosynthetic peptidoglycan transglycosylase [Bacteroides sp.]|nr:monofunctional biosynthetic peptidoglycan transglycosylase [Bacteroides sp.]MCM1378677.1 monofunctional biosynthetic peptidoglycan transglycosylase [Bacteroides sp.]MCM1444950.1 monofunctional biosynthetic peptidoglycan transglycosylase [Prevotella sp.]